MNPSCVGSWRVLSGMAGSSADGLTLALIRYHRHAGGWAYELLAGETVAYPAVLADRLRQSASLTGYELIHLSIEYTDWTAEVVGRCWRGSACDLFVWHPHNVFHEPTRGLTWSVGDPERLRVLLGVPVITHLRARDIASGGTGAPLIPNADALLFAEYETLLNLGGIANLTHLPTRTAYDISPCNQLLNALAQTLSPAHAYDPEGRFARTGQLLPELLEAFQRHPFFALLPPRALDNETVRRDFIQPVLAHPGRVEDKLHTSTVMIARVLAEGLQWTGAQRFTVTGGGAYNRFLMELLEKAAARAGIEFVAAPRDLIDYREALGFGLLGLLRYLGEDNTHGTWTGARRSHSSGLLAL